MAERSTSALVPDEYSDFRTKTFWEGFFQARSGKAFEWYGDWTTLKPLLLKEIPSSTNAVDSRDADIDDLDTSEDKEKDQDPGLRILVPGCGNSELSALLYDTGRENITNFDFSSTCVREMLLQHVRPRPKMRWLVMDMTQMSFGDESFDVVVDKGSLDALMGDAEDTGGVEAGHKFLSEVKRVLAHRSKSEQTNQNQKSSSRSTSSSQVNKKAYSWDFSKPTNKSQESNPKKEEGGSVPALSSSSMDAFRSSYICVTLSQGHVLETLLDAFSSLSGDNWATDMFWELTMHSIPPTEDMKKSPWQPFAIVVKRKEKPSNNDAALIDIQLDFTIQGRKVAETEQIVQVRQVVEEWKEKAKKRHVQMKKRREQARRLESSLSGLQAGQRVLVHLPADIQVGVEKLAHAHGQGANTGTDLVRFKAAVVDVEKEKLGKMKMICAVFLVPQGREHEWLFHTEEGQKELLEGCNVSRLIIISLVREQSYGTMNEIQAELSPLVLQLAPLSCREGDVKIQYLTIGDGIGKRETVHKCASDLNGPVMVEDVTLQEEGVPQTFRRMVFLESSDLIQSEALLHSNKQKMKKKRETKEVVVDHSYLPCNYHLAVSAGMSFAGLRKSNKKEPVRVLLVGLGGGGLPMFLSKQFPSDVTVIELDPVVERLAKDYFGFCETDELRSIVGDGIKYIQDYPAGEDSHKYDMIVVDASGSSSESISCPPKEFLQVAFLKELSNILAESGILAVNVVTRSKLAFENAMRNLKSVFGNLFCIQAEEDINRVVLGFKGAESLSLDSLKKDAVDHLRKVQRSKAHQKDLSDAILNDLMKIE